MTTNKICTTCKDEKSLDNFNKSKTGKYGVTSTCKTCVKKYNKDNSEKRYENDKKYRKNNPDKIYYKNNREKVLKRIREFRNKNLALVKEQQKKSIEKNRISGVYLIGNLINHKFYIGSTKNIKARWKGHKNDLINNRHHSKLMQEDYNKDSNIDDFVFIIIENVDKNCKKAELIHKEQYWIDFLEPVIFGYNTYTDANSSKGFRASIETKIKLSISHKGQISNNKGKKFDKNTNKYI